IYHIRWRLKPFFWPISRHLRLLIARRGRDSIPRVPQGQPGYRRRVAPLRPAVGAVLLSVVLTAAGNDAQIPSGRNFDSVGGNLANHRYSSLTKINKSTLSKLGGAWSIHLEDGKSPGTMQATPVAVDGVM